MLLLGTYTRFFILVNECITEYIELYYENNARIAACLCQKYAEEEVRFESIIDHFEHCIIKWRTSHLRWKCWLLILGFQQLCRSSKCDDTLSKTPPLMTETTQSHFQNGKLFLSQKQCVNKDKTADCHYVQSCASITWAKINTQFYIVSVFHSILYVFVWHLLRSGFLMAR